MPKTTDTYERAYAACSTLAVRGINPTVRTVAEFIGTNSPAIISPAIKDWKQSVAAESLRRLEIPEVPQQLVDTTVSLWRQAIEGAQLTVAREREIIAEEKAALGAALGRAEAGLRSLQKDFADYREIAEREALELRAALAGSENALTELQAQQGKSIEALAEARQTNATLAGMLEETRRNLERQQADWEGQFERDHAWHLARIAEEREHAQREAEDRVLRLEEALAFSRQQIATLNGYLDRSSAAAGELKGELKAVTEENQRLRADLETLRNTLAEITQRCCEAERRCLDRQDEKEKLERNLDQLRSAHAGLLQVVESGGAGAQRASGEK